MSDKDLKYKNKYLKYKNKYLNLKNQTGSGIFTLDYNRIDDTQLLQIAELMKINKTVTILNITNTTFSDKGFKALCDALKTNTTLQILNFTTSSLTDYQAEEIIKLLKINKTNLDIIIDYNNIIYYKYYKDYKKIITDLLMLKNFINTIDNKTSEEITNFLNEYTTLDITNTTISDIGFTKLCDALKTNRTLDTLYLGNNIVNIDLMITNLFTALKFRALNIKIILETLHLNITNLNDNNAEKIKDFLESNTTLQTLTFSSNQFTDEGKKYFNKLQERMTIIFDDNIYI